MHYTRLHFPEIDSTNNYLKNSYALLDNFTFVSTDYQSKGKGRETRSWISNIGENLMFSLLIKDEKLLQQAPFFSFYMAVEIAKFLIENKIKHLSIKWPNDIYVKDKKICGILLESQLPNYLVIGVGINVNQKEFPMDLRRPATSMALEKRKYFDLETLKNKLFDQIIKNFLDLNHNCYLDFVRKHNYLLNKKIKVIIDGQDYIGEVVGIDENLSLQVRSNNLLLHVESGEITIYENTK
jgi:biotin-[acetyl-CoA-carboxylase] ligase BirA-like protein